MAKSYEHLFAADKARGIRANVLYRKIEYGYVGTFYGYCGGGAYSDGYFWIDSDNDLITGDDTSEFPETFRSILLELRNESAKYESHDESEGEPSVLALELRGKGRTHVDGERWAYFSPRFKKSIVEKLSKEWGLSIRWK